MMGTNHAVDSTSTMTPEARALANAIFVTLSSEYVGFNLNNLNFCLCDDLNINPDDEARKVGYRNLQDLLESNEMKSWIRVEDVENDYGEVSRMYRAKPIGEYYTIYLEQRKAYRQKMKRKAQKERMYERTYGVTRNAAMGSKNYGEQQQEPPTSSNKNNNWNRNEGHQIDEPNGKANLGEQSSKNNQQSNNCSTPTKNNRPQPQEEQQKSKVNSNGRLDVPVPVPNRLSTTIHYQGLGEPAGLDDFYDDSSDENDIGNGDDWMNNKFGRGVSNNDLGTSTTTKPSIPNEKHSSSNSNLPSQPKATNIGNDFDEKGKRNGNIRNGMSSNASFATANDIWDEDYFEGEEKEDEDCSDDDDEEDDFRTVMGDDINIVDGNGHSVMRGNAPANHQMHQFGQQNGNGMGHPIQNGTNKSNSSNLRQMAPINSLPQLQQQNQMMSGSDGRKQQQKIIQPPNQQLREEGEQRPKPPSTQQKDRTKAQKQPMGSNVATKTKNVPEDILVDFGYFLFCRNLLNFSSSTAPQPTNNQIVSNSNEIGGQLEMGSSSFGTISMNDILTTTAVALPQFDLPAECNGIAHPHHFVPAECALLLCDVQEGFRQRIRYFPEVVSNICRMVKVAKLLDIQIIGTEQLNCGLGKIAVELQRFGKISYIPKSQFSMYIPLMQGRALPEGVKTLILCGFEAHISILQSAFDFQSHDFNVHLISDASSSSTMQNRLLAFKKLETCGIGLMTSDCAIHLLVGDSAHPKFPAIQKIINEHPAPETGLTYQLPAF